MTLVTYGLIPDTFTLLFPFFGRQMFYASVTGAPYKLWLLTLPRFKSTEVCHCVTGQVHGLLDPDDKGTTITQIIWNSTPSDTVLRPRRPESPVTPL